MSEDSNPLAAALGDAIAEVERSEGDDFNVDASQARKTEQELPESSPAVPSGHVASHDEFWGGTVYTVAKDAPKPDAGYVLPAGPAFADEALFEREAGEGEVAKMVQHSAGAAASGAGETGGGGGGGDDDDDEFDFEDGGDENADAEAVLAGARAVVQSQEAAEASAARQALMAERQREDTTEADVGRAETEKEEAVAAREEAALSALRAQYGEEAQARLERAEAAAAEAVPEDERVEVSLGGPLEEVLEEEEEEDEDEEDEDEEEEGEEQQRGGGDAGNTGRMADGPSAQGAVASLAAAAAPGVAQEPGTVDESSTAGAEDEDAVAAEWAAVESARAAEAAAVAAAPVGVGGVQSRPAGSEPLAFRAALAWWRRQAFEPATREEAEKELEEQAGGGGGFLCCGAGPARGFAGDAAQREEAVLLLSVARQALREEVPEHTRMMRTLYRQFTGSELVTASEWVDIGFQGSNPGTDLRSAGMLSVLCGLNFVDAEPKLAAAALRLSADDVQRFPLMAVGINFTTLCRRALRTGALTALVRKEGGVVRAFMKTYRALWLAFVKTWKKNACTVSEFHTVKSDLEAKMQRGIAQLVADYDAHCATQNPGSRGGTEEDAAMGF